MGEREFRLVAWPPDDQPVNIQIMTGLSLTVEPGNIIDMVKLHPNSLAAFKDKVKTFLACHSTKLAVSKSALSAIRLRASSSDAPDRSCFANQAE